MGTASGSNPATPLQTATPHTGLRWFSKLTCAATLFLIFAGGMVTSTSSGLAVPDWPLSYGMLFPPMIGGVFYEHGHRMIASTVGFMMLILAFWLGRSEPRAWVRRLGWIALAAVITQGILGGLTVIYLLPTPISVSHATLAQTFFLFTIILAYSQSREYMFLSPTSSMGRTHTARGSLLWRRVVILIAVVYVQLLLGAVMRHTQAGLAIPDFPQMAGRWWPSFDASMIQWINDWRFQNTELKDVTLQQVVIHFCHRFWALIVVAATVWVLLGLGSIKERWKKLDQSAWTLMVLLIFQVALGAFSIWTRKAPVIASLHVVTGAAFLGASVLLALRVYPWKNRSK